MVDAAYKEWKAGAKIYSNIFPLLFDSQDRIEYFNSLEEIYNAKDGIILLDEGHTFCDARNWQELPSYFSASLTQHRKNRLDIYITTQDFSFVDKRIRKLAEELILCEKVFRWPPEREGGSRKPLYLQVGRRVYCAVQTLEDGRDRIISYKSKLFFIRGKKILWWPASRRLYDTYNPIALKPYVCRAFYEKKINKKLRVELKGVV